MKELNQRTKKQITIWSVLLAFFLTVCIGCLISAHAVKENTYRQLISISKASAKQIREETYQRAIRLCPQKTSTYLLLLEMYSEDGIFDEIESETFLSLYNSNQNQLPSNVDGASICIQAGLLYINGYQDNFTVSLRMALPFFEDALPLITEEHHDFLTTSCYAKIGQYYRDYIWTAAAKEVPKERVATLLHEIDVTLDELSAEAKAGQPYDYLGFCNAVCNLLYGQRDILAVTVDLQTVISLLNRIYEEMPETNALQSDSSKQLVQTLRDNRELYYDMISRAFERNEGGLP